MNEKKKNLWDLFFEQVASKEDLKKFMTKKEMDERFDQVMERLNYILYLLKNLRNDRYSQMLRRWRKKGSRISI